MNGNPVSSRVGSASCRGGPLPRHEGDRRAVRRPGGLCRPGRGKVGGEPDGLRRVERHRVHEPVLAYPGREGDGRSVRRPARIDGVDDRSGRERDATRPVERRREEEVARTVERRTPGWRSPPDTTARTRSSIHLVTNPDLPGDTWIRARGDLTSPFVLDLHHVDPVTFPVLPGPPKRAYAMRVPSGDQSTLPIPTRPHDVVTSDRTGTRIEQFPWLPTRRIHREQDPEVVQIVAEIDQVAADETNIPIGGRRGRRRRYGDRRALGSRGRAPRRAPPAKPTTPAATAGSAACDPCESRDARTRRRQERTLAPHGPTALARPSSGVTCLLADRGAGARRERSDGARTHAEHLPGLLGREADVAGQETAARWSGVSSRSARTTRSRSSTVANASSLGVMLRVLRSRAPSAGTGSGTRSSPFGTDRRTGRRTRARPSVPTCGGRRPA